MRVWMREVGDELAACELTHHQREAIDVERAREQHAALASVLRELGCRVQVLPPLEGHADAPFLEDTALLLDRMAVIARPGAASRVGEVASIEAVLGEEFELAYLPEEARLEGGDVMRVGDTLFVGQSSRTNHPGLKALAHLIWRDGLIVKAVEVDACLHMQTAVCDLGEARVLVNPRWVESRRLRQLDRIEVDPREPFGANVLRVGRTIVASAAAPYTNDKLAKAGYELRVVELDEFHKAEAGVTCLTLRDRE